MFERYTEKARRVIFFARYEASQFGKTEIEPEHLLLGALRESPSVFKPLERQGLRDFAAFRQLLEARTAIGAVVSTSVDMPLSEAAKRSLHFAAEEAQALVHKFIGTEHLLLGILRVEESFAAQFMIERGLSAAELREQLRVAGPGEARLGAVANSREITHSFASALSLSPESVHAIAFAMEEARVLGHTQVEPLHLLLGLLRQQPSEAADLLAQAGITETNLRERLRRLSDGQK